MKALAIFFFLTSFTTLHAQLDRRDKIVGVWVCKEVSFLDDEEFANAPSKKQLYEMTTKGFLSSKIKFKADNTFSFQTANDASIWQKKYRL